MACVRELVNHTNGSLVVATYNNNVVDLSC